MIKDRALVSLLKGFFRKEIYPYVLNRYTDKKVFVTEKSKDEVVSEVDLTIQDKVAALVARTLPGIGLASEEREAPWPPADDEFIILDPLDGTHNFLMGIPLFGIMLAFVARGSIKWSVLFLPMEELWSSDGFYFAALGEGAWKYRNDETTKLSVSIQTDLERFQVLLEGKSKKILKSSVARALQEKVLRTRNNISMAWSVSRVASGGSYPMGIDAVVSFDNKPCDNIPGILFVEEAGGRVTNFDGASPSLVRSKSLMYSNGLLHAQLLDLAREGSDG